MLDNEVIFHWLEILMGIEPERARRAIRTIESWGIESVTRELVSEATIDNALAAMRLSEAVDELTKAGVPESKLLGKLRRDRGLWPTWAEIRAAHLLRSVTGADVQLEPNRDTGKHSDYALSFKGGQPVPIEFKAIGLSDEEQQFCQRISPELDRLVPPFGFLTVHAYLDTRGVNADRDTIDKMHLAARSAADKLDGFPKALAGVTIVGHGGEHNYSRRLATRLQNEVSFQIPEGAQGWGAFYWTNGAPLHNVIRAVQQIAHTKKLAGIVLLGDAVAFPARQVHSFVSVFNASALKESTEDPIPVKSTVDDKYGKDVLTRFERSSGVRAMLLATTHGGKLVELVRRDGKRRILPFNFLIDADPPVAQNTRYTADSRIEKGDDADSIQNRATAVFGLVPRE
jgi:hypothetical protein